MDRLLSAHLAAVTAWQSVVAGGRSLTDALEQLAAQVDESARPLALQLTYGLVRWHLRLDALLGQLTRKPLRRRDADVRGLLMVALFELEHSSSPDYAIVDKAVEAVRGLGKNWASGLVNGVLRNYLRRREALHQRLDADALTRYAMPRWLLDLWREDWPEQWERIATASNEHPPMTLRVNRGQVARDEYLESLLAAGIDAAPGPVGTESVTLERPQPARTLPGFDAGCVSVQDGGAQLAAELLDLSPGLRVLDACAAPGGKTCHIGEREPQLAELVALDVDAVRLRKLEENLRRCGVDGVAKAVDARDVSAWWDGRPFDRILLDSPCSATGVIRRHPDIRHLRRPGDLPQLRALQDGLLDALWPTLAPGGMLLYATCSVARTENESVVARFLRRCPDAEEDRLEEAWGWTCEYGRQLLPGAVGTDGFYYARLRKAHG